MLFGTLLYVVAVVPFAIVAVVVWIFSALVVDVVIVTFVADYRALCCYSLFPFTIVW